MGAIAREGLRGVMYGEGWEMEGVVSDLLVVQVERAVLVDCDDIWLTDDWE